MSDRYALFVWPAYAATALTFAVMIIVVVLRARLWRGRVERLEKEARR